jgi:hypothetical protein
MSFVGVGIATGVGALGGAIIEGNAASGAANTEANAAGASNAIQYQEYQNNLANEAPYLQAGNSALSSLQSQLPSLEAPFTLSDFQESPGYQFQLGQGEQAIQRSAAASGLLNSVGTEENLNNYAQGAANTDYQQALTNFTNSQQQRYNMLSGLVGVGQNAASMSNAAGTNYANAASNNLTGAANATAAGQVGTANATTGALSSGANTFSQTSLINSLLNKPQTTPGTPGTPSNMSQYSDPLSLGNGGAGGNMFGVNTNIPVPFSE